MPDAKTPETIYCFVEVQRSTHGDCSNGGISGDHDVLVLTDGFDDEYMGLPCVRVDSVRTGARTHLFAAPWKGKPDMIGPMAGGAKVHSADPSFKALTGTDKPIPLHDRFETQSLQQHDIGLVSALYRTTPCGRHPGRLKPPAASEGGFWGAEGS